MKLNGPVGHWPARKAFYDRGVFVPACAAYNSPTMDPADLEESAAEGREAHRQRSRDAEQARVARGGGPKPGRKPGRRANQKAKRKKS